MACPLVRATATSGLERKLLAEYDVHSLARVLPILDACHADTLVDTLTVMEMLLYTAELKRPVDEKLHVKMARANELILLLGLTGCKDTRIGNSMMRGISGGQVCPGALDPNFLAKVNTQLPCPGADGGQTFHCVPRAPIPSACCRGPSSRSSKHSLHKSCAALSTL